MRNCINLPYIRPIMVFCMSALFLSISNSAKAQIRFKVEILPDSMTYQVAILPDTTLASPSNRTSTAQITITVPSPTAGEQGFEVANVMALLPSTSWSANSHYNAPEENPDFDYISFGLNSLGTLGIPYVMGEEVVVFSFQNVGACTGPVELLTADDPFLPPNSFNANVDNQITTFGTGTSNNAYTGNYGVGTANCAREISPPPPPLPISDCLVNLELEQLDDGTYQLVFVADTTWISPNDSTLSAQITLLAPSNNLSVTNLTNLQNNTVFTLSNIYNSPPEHPSMDYFVFRLSFPTTQLSYVQGEKVPLFKFINSGDCAGDSLYLMNEETDPFAMPNSLGAEVGHRWRTSALDVATPICLDEQKRQPLGINIVDVILSHPSDCAATDGGITIVIPNFSPYEYSVNNGVDWSTSPQFINLGAGNYQILARYPNGTCTTSPMEFQLNEPSSPIIHDLSFNHPNDCNTSNGFISILSSNTYEYSIDGGTNWQTDTIFSNLSEGNYDVLARTLDTTCQILAGIINLNSPDAPEIISFSTHSSDCDSTNAAISITAACPNTNLICNLEYSINDGLTWFSDSTFYNLENSNYSIAARIAGSSCISGTQTATINAPSRPVLDSLTFIRPITCTSADGSIIVHALCDENCILEYSINDGENWTTSNVFEQLQADNYQISVRSDVNNCEEQLDNIALIAEDCCEVEYVLEELGNGRFQVSMIPHVTYNAPDNRTSTLQVTVLAPTNVLEINNLQSLIEEVVFEQNSRINSPDVNPETDYISFGLVTIGTENISYQSGVKVPLFTFDNIGACRGGDICLMNNEEDIFYPPNVENSNVGQQLTTLGGGVDVSICIGTPQHLVGTPYPEGYSETCVQCSEHCLITYELEQLDDGRFQVSMIPDTTIVSPDNYTSTAQITVVVASAEDGQPGFEVTAIENLLPNVFFENNELITNPDENPDADYLVFGLTTSGTEDIPYVAGEKVPLFIFDYNYCSGSTICLMEENDPFVIANSTIGNQLSISGLDIKPCLEGNIENTNCTDCPPTDCPSADLSLTSSGLVCSGESVQLSVSSPWSVLEYRWYYADSGVLFSTQQNPTISNLDSNTVFEVVAFSNTCFSDSSAFITVEISNTGNFLPSFSTETINNCVVTRLNLFANHNNDTLSDYQYFWTGPNGFTSNSPNPTIQNPSSAFNGNYSLSITNTINCEVTKTIQVENIQQEGILMPIISSTGPVCEGHSLTLSVDLYEGFDVDYIWQFPDSTHVTGWNTNNLTISPMIQDLHEGDYSVTVFVDGCSNTSDIYNLEVLEVTTVQPTVQPTIPEGSMCEGSSVQLLANAPNAVHYFWTGPNGFESIAANPVIPNVTIFDNGTYDLQASTVSGCRYAGSINVTGITAQPQQPTIISNSPVCENDTIRLRIQENYTGNDITYSWYNTFNQVIGTAEELAISVLDPAAQGPFRVQVTVNGCLSDYADFTSVDIVPPPAAKVTAPNNAMICNEQELFLESNFVEQAQYEWRVLNNSQIISTEQNPIIQNINETTSFELSISLTGCSIVAKDTLLVSVETTPVIENLPPVMIACEGSNVILSANNAVLNESVVQFTWTAPNNLSYSGIVDSMGLIELELPAIHADAAGNYTLVLETEACASNPESIVVQVEEALSTPSLSLEDNVLCEGQSLVLNSTTYEGQNVNYHWYFSTGEEEFLLNTTNQPNLLLSTATPANSGFYSVQVTKNGCESNRSNLQEVWVFGPATNIAAFSNQDSLGSICEGTNIQLGLPYIPDATYQWFGPNNFSSTQLNPLLLNATAEDAGEYYALVTLENCASVVTQATEININATPPPPLLTRTNVADEHLNHICEGEDLNFMIANPPTLLETDSITYHWYFETADTAFEITTEPTLSILNATTTHSGIYTAVLVFNGCNSDLSEPFEVEVNIAPNTNIANAGQDSSFCATNLLALNADLMEGDNGFWTSPTGATFSDSTASNSQVINLVEGENLLVWTISRGACFDFSSDTLHYQIDNVPIDIANAGEDLYICGDSLISLQADQPVEQTGIWTQSQEQIDAGVTFTNPNLSFSTVEGIVDTGFYTFTWTLYSEECGAYATDEVMIHFGLRPEGVALIEDDEFYTCGEEEVIIEGSTPPIGVQAQWSSTSTATIEPVDSPRALVSDLEEGEHFFTWSFSTEGCPDFSSDTIRIAQETAPQANLDTISLMFNDTLTGLDVLANDLFGGINPDIIRESFLIKNYPDNGTLIEQEEGIISYLPQQNFFGVDTILYEICNLNCSDINAETACSTAMLLIKVSGTSPSGECFAPNIISPNEDGVNDALTFGCIDNYPDNQLFIFNRWGTKIHEIIAYQNDWEGVWEGKPLPAGVYFYVFKQDKNSTESIQGHFSIFR